MGPKRACFNNETAYAISREDEPGILVNMNLLRRHLRTPEALEEAILQGRTELEAKQATQKVSMGLIRGLAVPGMKPKALTEAVKAQFPGATKKVVARATLLSVILSAESDPDTQALHDLAMDTRDNSVQDL